MKNRRFILLLLFSVLVVTCKKYPENTLWFKNPEKVFRNGKITSFKVDGEDSIPLFNSTWGVDITSKEFNLTRYENYYLIGGDYFTGTWEFHDPKNMLFVLEKINEDTNQKLYNPFLGNGAQGLWKIIKLTRKGALKLKRQNNGKTYELQFN